MNLDFVIYMFGAIGGSTLFLSICVMVLNRKGVALDIPPPTMISGMSSRLTAEASMMAIL